jgi:hypothetical protein
VNHDASIFINLSEPQGMVTATGHFAQDFQAPSRQNALKTAIGSSGRPAGPLIRVRARKPFSFPGAADKGLRAGKGGRVV